MNEYHKIQTVFKRDPATNHKTLLEGEYATPEFEYLKDARWLFTEKVDGTNVRVEKAGGLVRFKGRTERSQMPMHLLDVLEGTFDLDGLHRVGEEFILYGEGYGAKIQKGGGNYIPDGCDFVLFDVRVGGWWLRRDDVEDVAEKLGIRVVPFLGAGTLAGAVEMARAGIHSRVSLSSHMAEGLVLRPAVEILDRAGHRIIAKIKSRDFE